MRIESYPHPHRADNKTRDASDWEDSPPTSDTTPSGSTCAERKANRFLHQPQGACTDHGCHSQKDMETCGGNQCPDSMSQTSTGVKCGAYSELIAYMKYTVLKRIFA